MAADVGLERGRIEQVALRRPPRRVADHAGPATDDGHRLAAGALQTEQAEDRHEVADMKRRAAGIEPDVAGDGPAGRQPIGQSGRRRVQDPPPLELGQQVDRPTLPGAAPSQSRSLHRLEPGGRPSAVVHEPYAIVQA